MRGDKIISPTEKNRWIKNNLKFYDDMPLNELLKLSPTTLYEIFSIPKFLVEVLDSYNIEITPLPDSEGVNYAEANQKVGKTFESTITE